MKIKSNIFIPRIDFNTKSINVKMKNVTTPKLTVEPLTTFLWVCARRVGFEIFCSIGSKEYVRSKWRRAIDWSSTFLYVTCRAPIGVGRGWQNGCKYKNVNIGGSYLNYWGVWCVLLYFVLNAFFLQKGFGVVLFFWSSFYRPGWQLGRKTWT